MLVASLISLGKDIQEAAELVVLGNEMFMNLNQQIKQLVRILERRNRVEVKNDELLQELYSYLIEISGFVKRQSAQNYIIRLFNSEKTFKRVQMYESGLHGRMLNLNLVRGIDQAKVTDLDQSQETIIKSLKESYQNDIAELKELVVKCLMENKTVEEKIVEMKINDDNYVETMDLLASSEIKSTFMNLPQTAVNELETVKRKLQLLSHRSIIPVEEIHTIQESDLIYESQNPFGFGSFGVVYKAKLLSNGRLVAVKKANDNVRDDSLIKMLLKEAQVWKDLHHENVLPLLGVNLNIDKPFLVMPYMINGSVYSYLSANPMTSIETRINFMTDTAAGLNYLHENGIIHGDIKPDNLLLDDKLNCMLTDFGMARAKLGTNSSLMKSSRPGALRFSAPEKSQPGFANNQKTDMFAYGMTFYQVLTGLIPFEEEPDQFLVYSWVRDGHRPSARAELVPPIIWDLISRTWAQNPKERPDFACINGFLGAFRKMKNVPVVPLANDSTITEVTTINSNGVLVLKKVDSNGTMRDDATVVKENIEVPSQNENSRWFSRILPTNRTKYAAALGLLLFAIGLTLGLVFGAKGGSSPYLNSSSTPTNGSDPQTSTALTVPDGAKIAAASTGTYNLGSVKCNNYNGTECEKFCIQSYNVALISNTNSITSNQTSRIPLANCTCKSLTANDGIGQYLSQNFAIAPSGGIANVYFGTVDQGCNLTYYLDTGGLLLQAPRPSSNI